MSICERLSDFLPFTNCTGDRIGIPSAAIAPFSSWFLFCNIAWWSVKVCRSSSRDGFCGGPKDVQLSPSPRSWKCPWSDRAIGWPCRWPAVTPATPLGIATSGCARTELLSSASASGVSSWSSRLLLLAKFRPPSPSLTTWVSSYRPPWGFRILLLNRT